MNALNLRLTTTAVAVTLALSASAKAQGTDHQPKTYTCNCACRAELGNEVNIAKRLSIPTSPAAPYRGSHAASRW